MSSRPARRARDAYFRTSVGLREGCDAEGRVFDVSRAVRTARAWMKCRLESGQPALSVMFTRAEVLGHATRANVPPQLARPMKEENHVVTNPAARVAASGT
jgi:hypothetical protein